MCLQSLSQQPEAAKGGGGVLGPRRQSSMAARAPAHRSSLWWRQQAPAGAGSPECPAPAGSSLSFNTFPIHPTLALWSGETTSFWLFCASCAAPLRAAASHYAEQLVLSIFEPLSQACGSLCSLCVAMCVVGLLPDTSEKSKSHFLFCNQHWHLYGHSLGHFIT